MIAARAIGTLATILALACAAPAHADSRLEFGVHLGVPLYWPPYVYPYRLYYYYPPPPIYYPPPATHWYYYCRESNAYYPYVRACPGGWQRVSPVPPGELAG